MAPLPIPFPSGVIFRIVPEKTFRALDAADGDATGRWVHPARDEARAPRRQTFA